jgi:hypothetical protein
MPIKCAIRALKELSLRPISHSNKHLPIRCFIFLFAWILQQLVALPLFTFTFTLPQSKTNPLEKVAAPWKNRIGFIELQIMIIQFLFIIDYDWLGISTLSMASVGEIINSCHWRFSKHFQNDFARNSERWIEDWTKKRF